MSVHPKHPGNDSRADREAVRHGEWSGASTHQKRPRKDVDPAFEDYLMGITPAEDAGKTPPLPEWKALGSPVETPVPPSSENTESVPSWRKLTDVVADRDPVSRRSTAHEFPFVTSSKDGGRPSSGINPASSQAAPAHSEAATSPNIFVRRLPVFIFATVLIWSIMAILLYPVDGQYTAERTIVVDPSSLTDAVSAPGSSLPGYVMEWRTALQQPVSVPLPDGTRRAAGSGEPSLLPVAPMKGTTVTMESLPGDAGSEDTYLLAASGKHEETAVASVDAYANQWVAEVNRAALESTRSLQRQLQGQQSLLTDELETLNSQLDRSGSGEGNLASITDRTTLEAMANDLRRQISNVEMEISALRASMATLEQLKLEEQKNQQPERRPVSPLLLDSDPEFVSAAADTTSLNASADPSSQLWADLTTFEQRLEEAETGKARAERELSGVMTQLRTLPAAFDSRGDLERRREEVAVELDDVSAVLVRLESLLAADTEVARIRGTRVVSSTDRYGTLLRLLLGVVLGLVAGVIAVFARERLDTRIHDAVKIAAQGIPVAGTVPALRKVSRRSKREFLDRRISSELVSLTEPKRKEAIAFEQLAERLSPSSDTSRILVFSGAKQHTGTSVLSANTAVQLARSGARVLLVDANYLHPSQMDIMGWSEQAQYDLANNTFAPGTGIEAFSKGLPNLYGLCVKMGVAQNTDGRSHTDLAKLLERARAKFDVIVVDTPSLKNSSLALRLARNQSSLFIAFKSGKTHRRDLADVLNKLAFVTDVAPSAVLIG